jgi:hypothetical protein
MEETAVRDWVRRYARLKARKQAIEAEMGELRQRIIEFCNREAPAGFQSGSYRVRLVRQERKEYDDHKLYGALPDPALWRLVSRADADKIAGLLKIGVLTPEQLADTYAVRHITLLQIEKT